MRHGRARAAATLVGLVVALLLAVLTAVALGSSPVPPGSLWSFITSGNAATASDTVVLQQIRMPRVATAILAGCALGVAGLLMQTLFNNPLADPYILGASSGASLAVAVATLGLPGAAGAFVSVSGGGRYVVVLAAAIGAFAVLAAIAVMAQWVRSVATLLIVGVMLGSLSTALVSLMLAYTDPVRLQRFILWGMGSLSGVIWADLALMAPAVAVGLAAAFFLAPSLNALLLGEDYAASMGVRVRTVRLAAIAAAAVLCAVITAFCGPIAFLGMAVPHLARRLVASSDHRLLLPATALMGATVAVVCSIISQLPGAGMVLPLNVVTALLGAPVVIAVLLASRGRLAGGGA